MVNTDRKTAFYVGNFERPNNNAPGKRVFGISLILQELGYDVIMIGKSKDHSKVESYGDSIIYNPFPDYGMVNAKRYVDYINQMCNTYGKPRFIIRYGSPCTAVFDYQLTQYCKSNHIYLFADVVDWLPTTGNNIIFNMTKALDTLFEKVVFNSQVDGVIAISSYLAEYYRKKGCKTIIIPPLVSSYTENLANNKDVVFIYAGSPFRLGEQINNRSKMKDRLDVTIAIMCKLIDLNYSFQFDIYGITKEEYLKCLPNDKNMVEKSNGRVSFHGKKNMEIVQAAINKADFSLLVRDVNRGSMAGFPTKVVESLSLGTPVITNRTSDIESYIIDGANGYLLDSNTIDGIMEKMKTIMEEYEKKSSLMKKNCYTEQSFLFIKYIDIFKAFLCSFSNL